MCLSVDKNKYACLNELLQLILRINSALIFQIIYLFLQICFVRMQMKGC